jgi:hypothetical protein
MARADTKYPGFKSGNLRWYPDDMIIAPPTNGKYFFVDGSLSTGGSGTSWSDAFADIQAGVDACTSRNNDVVFVAPRNSSANNNRYDGNIKIAKRSVTLVGVGNNFKRCSVRSSSGTLVTLSGLDGVSYLGIGMYVVSTATDVEISGFQFDASGTYLGLYIGDGNRIDATIYAGGADTEGSRVHHNLFKYGTTGVMYDGSAADHIFHDNILYKQSDNGAYLGPGGTQQTQRVYILDNIFSGCEDYGVFVYNSAENKDHVVARNVFKDQKSDTTEMVNPVIIAEGTATSAVVGNWNACDNDNSLGTKQVHAGNYDGTLAGGGVFVDET